MSFPQFHLVRITVIISYLLISTNTTKSQIVPDATTNSAIIDNCADSCQITGGKLAGENLFHSFRDFNVRSGESVYFADPGVANIFSRVTGNSTSQIFGTLGVSGDSNLFLLNPNGIIFGAGAILDLNGSFFATTADEIQFGDNGSFAASPNSQENLALLTVNPNALFFNQMRQNGAIAINNTSLSLPETETLTLLGKQTTETVPGINLTGGEIIIPQGKINLGAVSNNGKVDINPDGQLELSTDLTKGDISLSQQSNLDVSGIGAGNVSLQGKNINISGESQIFANTLGNISGGEIELQGNNITLTENSDIGSFNFGIGQGAGIQLTANKSINLVGVDPEAIEKFLGVINNSDPDVELSSTVIFSDNRSDDPNSISGNIILQSKNLNLSNGTWVLTSVDDRGSAGNIDIDVSENIAIDNAGLLSGVDFGVTGNSANVTVNAQNLQVSHSGIISSVTTGKGSGGNINLNIADTIQLDRSLSNRSFPTIINTTTVANTGTGGDITVNANKLIIRDGAEISSGSGGFTIETGIIPIGGQGGNITVNTSDSIEITGISPENLFPSGIVNRTLSNNPAGDIEVNTGKLEVAGQGIISASSLFGLKDEAGGKGGNLTVNADEYIHLSGTGLEIIEEYAGEGLSGEIEIGNLTGGLLTNTVDGEAGNTQITTPKLVLMEGALISTSTLGTANGGNLNIVANDIEIVSSLVASSTIGDGTAGNITIDTERLTTDRNGFISTSSGGMGNGGNLEVNATDFIKLLSSAESSIVPSGLITTSIGLSYPGNLEVNTKDLIIRQGASIAVNSQTNNPLIQESIENIEIPEELINSQPPRFAIVNAESIEISGFAFENVVSSISSTTSSAFPASNIQINTSELSISDRADISVSSIGKGQAGNLRVVADNLFLSNDGKLNATTSSGRGGNINLHINELLSLNNRAAIQTDALDTGNGGNIQIDTNFAISKNKSIISAQAISGQGGNIDILATDLFISPESLITASATAELGIDGEVNIQTFNTNTRNSLVRLSATTLQEDSEIASGCSVDFDELNVFSYIGRGGLPSSPLTEYDLSDRDLLADFTVSQKQETTFESTLENNSPSLISPVSISEATTWKINNRGKVELIARKDLALQSNIMTDSSCPFIE